MLDHVLSAQQIVSDVQDLTKFIGQAREITDTRRREPADTKRLERIHKLVDNCLHNLNYNVQRYCADCAAETPKSAE